MGETVPKFQYPCYVDVCTFPHQYCNSDRNERRCSPCTDTLCEQERKPLACQYYCIKRNGGVATPSPIAVTTRTGSQVSQWNIDLVPLAHLVWYIAFVSTAVFILILIAICLYCLRNTCTKPMREKKRPVQESGENMSPTAPAYELRPLLSGETHSPCCVHSQQSAQLNNKSDSPPPSYVTNDCSVNTGANMPVQPTNTQASRNNLSDRICDTSTRQRGEVVPIVNSSSSTGTHNNPASLRHFNTNVTTEEGNHEKPWSRGFGLSSQPMPPDNRSCSDNESLSDQTNLKQSNAE